MILIVFCEVQNISIGLVKSTKIQGLKVNSMQAVEILRERNGENDHIYGGALASMALLFAMKKETVKARDAYRNGLKVQESLLQAESSSISYTINHLYTHFCPVENSKP